MLLLPEPFTKVGLWQVNGSVVTSFSLLTPSMLPTTNVGFNAPLQLVKPRGRQHLSPNSRHTHTHKHTHTPTHTHTRLCRRTLETNVPLHRTPKQIHTAAWSPYLVSSCLINLSACCVLTWNIPSGVWGFPHHDFGERHCNRKEPKTFLNTRPSNP